MGGNISCVRRKSTAGVVDAARQGQWEEVAKALERGVDVNSRNKRGMTILHFAANAGNLEKVMWVCGEKSADVNLQSIKHGRTPIMFAARHGHLEVVKYLHQECKANLELQAPSGDTVITRACFGAKVDVVKYLVEDANMTITEAEFKAVEASKRNEAGEAVVAVMEYLQTHKP